MTYIETTSEEHATGETAAIYAGDRERTGYLPNYTKVFSARPEVYRAWQQLSAAVRENIDLRRYELATLAAARRLGSDYCALAHGSILRERFFQPDALAAVARDRRSAGLDAADVAVMDLAEKVAGDASSVTEADIERLRELGLADEEILDVILAASIRAFFSKVLAAADAEPDPAYDELEPDLRRALLS
jgi:uncharacterized peroxidase-related enzyme